jgi:hypothetical protein
VASGLKSHSAVKIEGAAYVPRRGSSRALLLMVKDNDLGLVVPIPEHSRKGVCGVAPRPPLTGRSPRGGVAETRRHHRTSGGEIVTDW